MKGYSKAALIEGIRSLGIESDDTLMIHSSMKTLGNVAGGVETVLDAFCEYLSEGLLLFPTHTWKEWNNPDLVFDVKNEPSCVGILAETFRKRPGVLRSWHPTHSVAGLGRKAAVFLAGEELTGTPCPRTGCWGRLYDENARILFLGAPVKTNTFLHSVEEWYDIPDRLAVDSTGFRIRTPEGRLIPCPQHRHHSSLGDVSQHYDKLESMVLQEGIAVEGTIADARCVCMSARKLADRIGRLLEQFPHLFNDNRSMSDVTGI